MKNICLHSNSVFPARRYIPAREMVLLFDGNKPRAHLAFLMYFPYPLSSICMCGHCVHAHVHVREGQTETDRAGRQAGIEFRTLHMLDQCSTTV